MSFFAEIYGSWSKIQEEKYDKILTLMKESGIRISGRILDIGAGPLFFEKFLEKKGVDTSGFVCIDIEKKYASGRGFVLADGVRLPFSGNSFRLIFCIDAIHLIGNGKEMERVLAPGGYAIVCSFFNEENLAIIEKGIVKKLNGFKLSKKTIIKGRENELILAFRKPGTTRRSNGK